MKGMVGRERNEKSLNNKSRDFLAVQTDIINQLITENLVTLGMQISFGFDLQIISLVLC